MRSPKSLTSIFLSHLFGIGLPQMIIIIDQSASDIKYLSIDSRHSTILFLKC